MWEGFKLNSQYHNDEKFYSNGNRSLIDEIINIEKLRKLDDRYIITDICKDIDLKYYVDDEVFNVYHSSFGFSLSFDNKTFKSLAGFIDVDMSTAKDKDRFILFLKNIMKSKKINLSGRYFREILNKFLDKNVKEIIDFKDDIRIYTSKIVDNDRELIFVTIK